MHRAARKFAISFRWHSRMLGCDESRGLPDDAVLTSAGDVTVGTIPAGRYVTTVHHGHPDGLIDATGAVLEWAAAEGLAFKLTG